MLRIKILSKKIIKYVFILSLVLHFYLSTISEYNLFVTEKSNIIFKYSNVFINTIFMFILLLVIIIQFSKFMYYVDINIQNKNNIKWLLKKDNLVIIAKLAIITLPFVIIYLVDFFIRKDHSFEFAISVLVFASSSVIFVITLIIMYTVYNFVVKRRWITTYEKEFNFMIESIYFQSIFLNVLNFDQSNYTFELKEEIKIFLTSTNEENDIIFNENLSLFLNETKKATTPPLV
ncbi:hypothetical protein [Spiroplasma diminutum]|uniref:Transmembrane protein n=1 Tax=Spiroplasma diminutum CUAS-1 TaxID=1276221 RepID=S5M0S7_9MOLU|nr:hypothetical protein [Spiroplasma diminutum]AGR42451.1 hypothetical protein SDIMI_v3c07470 [Spiroplasma diminutum CUAS-1]